MEIFFFYERNVAPQKKKKNIVVATIYGQVSSEQTSIKEKNFCDENNLTLKKRNENFPEENFVTKIHPLHELSQKVKEIGSSLKCL